MATIQVALRLEEDLVERVDRLIEAVPFEDVRPTRSALIKAALARGLDQMEGELDRGGKRKRR